ncbi:MAG TPA: TIR domain-containing protein [Sphingomicrobium sp.]|nr:TIR domain-containing protein [Sphingomicrobium sp.]
MSETDIFLSYARQDRGTARLFADGLVAEGFTVWWDASLRSGETFDEVIERNLRDAKAVVVLWSPASVASRWVRAEATLADRRNKLAPAIIAPCDRPIIFELTHAAELSDWTGDMSDPRWRTFVSDLKRLTNAAAEPPPVKLQPVPVSKVEEPIAPVQPPPRQLLRPGNDEVILAAPARRDPPVVQRPAAPEPIAAEAPPQGEVHCLEIEDGDVSGEPIVIDPAGVKIGRSAPADIVVPHKSVSREHCLIGLANDELLVTDLNSTNGTFIDDARISRASVLPVGSVLRLGQVSLRHAVYNPADIERYSRAAGSDDTAQAPRLAATS